MTTSTEIANRALSAIAAKATISNLELEQSNEAKQARLLYGSTRDALFRAAPWNFTTSYALLSLLKAAPGTPENPSGATTWDPATMPPPPWLYEYAYPSDCLMMRFVSLSPSVGNPLSPPIFPYTQNGLLAGVATRYFKFVVSSGRATDGSAINVVLTNANAALGCYTARIDTEDLWDAAFQEAMVYALATRLAMALTGKLDIAKLTAQQAMSTILQARARDGNEGLTKVDHTPDWIVARGVDANYWNNPFVAPWATPSFLVF